jgi:methionine sulfoxide reductase heme-binding subunit
LDSTVRKFLAGKWSKVAIFLLCLSPLGFFAYRALHEGLTANPVEFIQHFTGDWTLRFLLITLSITPLRKLLNLPELIRFRRMFGLFAFFYVCLHFLTYLGPDQSFNVAAMLKDVAKRRYIFVGFAAFVLLIPLAITSTQGWIRRLGGRRWQALHRSIYAIGILGVVHYYWLVKSDVRKPLFYAAILAVLLLWRVVTWLRKRKQTLVTARTHAAPSSTPQSNPTAS